jgi:predicted Zn-ribbon and HTH transcriptional regulator
VDHERLVQESLRAVRRAWELVLLRGARWVVSSGSLLLCVWTVIELASGRGPGVAAALLFLLLPCLAYFRWRRRNVETRLVRCALRDVLWRERIAPAACFDCGADLRSPEAVSGGRCRACGSALLRERDDPAPELQGLNRPDPFHRGLEHATELRHLQGDEGRRLAEEAKAAARRAPIVRTLRRTPIIVSVGVLVWFVLICNEVVPWRQFVFPVVLLCLGQTAMNLAAGQLEKRIARQQIRQGLFVARLPPASCFRCRANLAGVTASRCPGCGALLLPETSAPGH